MTLHDKRQELTLRTTYQLHVRFTNFVLLLFTCLLCPGCLQPDDVTYQMTAQQDVPLSDSLKVHIKTTLDDVLENRLLSHDVHAAWQVLHGVLAYGSQFPLETPRGKRSALEYLLDGGTLEGWTFEPGDLLNGGRRGLRSVVEPGGYRGQGHADQWLAILAQSGLTLETAINVQGTEYRMSDFLAQAQREVPYNTEREWSWTVIGLTQFLPTSSTWQTSDGETWSTEILVQRELEMELASSACGGTHRLIGLAMSLEKRLSEGAAITEVWQNVQTRLQSAVDTARRFQNADGSFSSNYFSRPGITSDGATLLATTGHTLEFLALTLSAQELREPWVQRAAVRLCRLLDETRDIPLECGALYHAVHGLAIYHERVFAD